MFTHNPESPTKLILDHILRGDVLSREQFFFKPENVASVINAIERFGINPGRKDAGGNVFPDPKGCLFVLGSWKFTKIFYLCNVGIKIRQDILSFS